MCSLQGFCTGACLRRGVRPGAGYRPHLYFSGTLTEGKYMDAGLIAFIAGMIGLLVGVLSMNAVARSERAGA